MTTAAQQPVDRSVRVQDAWISRQRPIGARCEVHGCGQPAAALLNVAVAGLPIPAFGPTLCRRHVDGIAG